MQYLLAAGSCDVTNHHTCQALACKRAKKTKPSIADPMKCGFDYTLPPPPLRRGGLEATADVQLLNIFDQTCFIKSSAFLALLSLWDQARRKISSDNPHISPFSSKAEFNHHAVPDVESLLQRKLQRWTDSVSLIVINHLRISFFCMWSVTQILLTNRGPY